MYSKQKIHAVKVVVSTPQKPFSEWKLEEVFELYGLGENPNLRLLPEFECCREPVQGCIPGLIDNLKEAYSSTPLIQHTSKSIYTWVFLSKIVAVINSKSDQQFRITPQYPVMGPYGRGPVDYSINVPASGTIVGITEAKREDFQAGIAQNMVQIESVTAGKKRKADEMDDVDADAKPKPIRCFGIVTDAKTWVFLEHSRIDGIIKFKRSREYTVLHQPEGFGKSVETVRTDMFVQTVETVAETIMWLLTMALNDLNPPDAPTNQPAKKSKCY